MSSSQQRARAEVESKLRQYQQFVDLTLKRDLGQTTQLLEKMQQKETDYTSLRTTLETMQAQQEKELKVNPDQPFVEPMQSMINLGSEFYVQAVVPDPTHICLDVGLGFHVELTLPEAISFINTKLPSLQKKSAALKEQISMIQGKIKVVYEGMAELMKLQEEQRKERKGFYE